jgi:hypothetical protein
MYFAIACWWHTEGQRNLHAQVMWIELQERVLQDLVDDDPGNVTCRAGCTGGHDGVDKRKGDFMIGAITQWLLKRKRRHVLLDKGFELLTRV